MSRVHLTVSRVFVGKLKRARVGQSHVQPGATDEQVVDAALDLLLAQQEKRRASVPPRVKRKVRRRDAGKCQWKLDSGGVCGSEVRLEIDHVVPRGKGGPSTVENCRLACRVHNQYSARQVYGEEVMGRYAGNPVAGEPCAAYSVRGDISRSFLAVSTTSRAAWSTSSSVLKRPRPKRMEEWASSSEIPIARST
jgi:5-methylcytosine-specific restriction endonuclease McrA